MTPAKSTQPDPPPPRRPRLPNAPIEGPVQAGRRPSNPLALFAIAAAWIACGVIALVQLKAGWKIIPGAVFIGVGLLFLRGALATVSRRAGPDAGQRPGEPDR